LVGGEVDFANVASRRIGPIVAPALADRPPGHDPSRPGLPAGTLQGSVEIDAAALAVLHGLRGCDATHLAASTTSRAAVVAADGALVQVARAGGLATVDVSF